MQDPSPTPTLVMFRLVKPLLSQLVSVVGISAAYALLMLISCLAPDVSIAENIGERFLKHDLSICSPYTAAPNPGSVLSGINGGV